MDKFELLRRVYGYDRFRPGQESLIDGVLSGRDVFGIMPTGGGKSICYQVPALLLPGITLVISPLISLMRDQVMALKNAGIPAAYINSTLNHAQMQLVYRNLLAGMYKIVYVAPERLDYAGFGSVVARLNISFLAVDEAHCISQWGQDFRPSYLRIVNFVDALPVRPVVGAYTATATAKVRQDVERILGLKDPVRALTGFDRPNLNFEVFRPESKDKELLRLLALRKRKSGIVYCTTRKVVENVCDLLKDNGYAATRYHAGLEEQERTQNQEDFIHDRATIMVATNAFGMGIDKSNVSFVIHYNMPKSIEAYYQEAGRAGRDGTAADCLLLFAERDVQIARFLIEQNSDNEEMDPHQQLIVRQQDMDRLALMVGYCKSKLCLRSYILEYFGQKHSLSCGNCGNCRGEYEQVDITTDAKRILTCIMAVEQTIGYPMGITNIGLILQGSRSRKLLELGLNKLSSYGVMKDIGRSRIREIADHLEAEGFVRLDQEHQTLEITEKGMDILNKSSNIQMLQPRETAPLASAADVQQNPSADPDLYELLRQHRADIAKENNIAPYLVFSNATLSDMAAKKPVNVTQFKKISGVGELKATWYAQSFLRVIKNYIQDSE